MRNPRLLSLVRKEFIQIARDPRTLALTFAMPVIQLFLLGFAATSDVREVPLAVWDQDRSSDSRALVDAYRSADYFKIAFEADSEAELRTLVDRGSARAGLIIPPGFAHRVLAGDTARVAFVIDGSDPTVAGTALAVATLVGQARGARLSLERLSARGGAAAALARPPLEVRSRVWYNPDLVSAYYMVPALIGLILQFLTVILTSTAIVRERERGTIEQLIVTPIRAWELVLGKLLPYMVIGFIGTLEILAAGVLIFGVPIAGSIPLLLLLSGLFLVTTLGLGLFISTIASTQQEAMITSLFFNLPSIFLSGFFFPLEAMPRFLQLVSYLIPLRYFLVIVRGIVLKGVGLPAIWPEVLALAVFAVLIMGGAALRFHKRLD